MREETVRAMFGLMPADSREPFSLVQEIRQRIQPMTDEGTSMDTGGGFASADLWFTVSGQEYVLTVKRSGQGAQNGPDAALKE